MLAELINNDLGDSPKDHVIRRGEENKCKNICIFFFVVLHINLRPSKLAQLSPVKWYGLNGDEVVH